MLVLTRKRSEKIHIGDNIVIKVIKSGRNSVKIGIEAPDDVRVLRAELCEGQPAVKSLEPLESPPAEEAGARLTAEDADEPYHHSPLGLALVAVN